MNIFLLFITTITIHVQLIHSLPLHIIYFDQKPFIYTENNQAQGIIPDYYDALKGICNKRSAIVEYKLNTTFVKFINLYDNNSIKYGSAELSSVHKDKATWLPMLTTPFSTINGDVPIVLFHSPSIAIIIQRRQISFTYKLWLGIKGCQHILAIAGILLVFFAILIWMAEWHGNPEISKSFVLGGFQGIWLAAVTMTTVGYGDLAPRSFLGRFIIMVWMIMGIIIASLITATVSDTLSGTSHIDPETAKLAVLKDSTEKIEMIKNYNTPRITEYSTYEEVLQAVRNDEVDMALMNSDVASYYKMNENKHLEHLVIVRTLEIKLPVVMRIPPIGFNDENFTNCVFEKGELFLQAIITGYRKQVQTTALYVEPIHDFFTKNDYILYPCVAVAGLVVAGMIFEIIWRLVIFIQNRRHSKQNGVINTEEIGMEIYQNGHAKNTDADLPKNSSKLEVELAKLRADISVVKQNVLKMSLMAQYKQKCSVCEWNT